MNKEKNTQDEGNLSSPLEVRGRWSVIKICGMKYPSNILEVAVLQPDFMGFIFYPKSPRYAEPLDSSTLKKIPDSIKKIGVFVNENLENILTIVYKYKLNGVQLHGAENIDLCNELHDAGLLVIKAFSISDAYNFKVTKSYEGSCDYFLFDTKTDSYGGSGVKFNWKILDEYKGETPFLLSGGITSEDAADILKIKHPKMAGIDLNSKFEIEPGVKDVSLLQEFLKEIRTSNP